MMNEPTNREILDALIDFREAVERCFEGVDRRFERVDHRFEALETRVTGLESEMRSGFRAVDVRLSRLERPNRRR